MVLLTGRRLSDVAGLNTRDVDAGVNPGDVSLDLYRFVLSFSLTVE